MPKKPPTEKPLQFTSPVAKQFFIVADELFFITPINPPTKLEIEFTLPVE